jgi:hypothetical protein
MGVGRIFGLPDSRQLDSYGSDGKILTGQKFRLLLKVRALLGYVQKQQSAILTVACNAHFAAHMAGSHEEYAGTKRSHRY